MKITPIYCSGKLVVNGISKARKQHCKCKNCSKNILENYTYNVYFLLYINILYFCLPVGFPFKGLEFILYTRPNTTFLLPLQQQINTGQITVKPVIFN